MKLFTTLFFSLFILGSIGAQDISWTSDRPQNVLIEGCGAGEFTLKNEGDQTADLSIALSGNYDESDIETDLTSSVELASGESYTFHMEALSGGSANAEKHVTITVSSGNEILHENKISLEKELTLTVSPDSDFTACPGDRLSVSAQSNGRIEWLKGEGSGDTWDFQFWEETEVSVAAFQGSCMESFEFTISPSVNVKINHDEEILYLCKGDSPVTLTADTKGAGAISWSSRGFQFSQEPDQAIRITPETSGTLYATVSSGDCTVTDTLEVRVDSLPEFVFDTIPNKDPYCPGEIVSIYGKKLQQDRFPDVTYEWQPETGILSDKNKANLTITTTDTITYVRTTRNNACESIDSITLNVDNPPVELNFTDTVICPNQTVEIELKNPERFKSYEWGPEEEVSCTECVKTKASPSQSTTITLSLETEHCPTSANVNINIKPPRPITIDGESPVCPEDEVQLVVVEMDEYKSFEWSGSVDFSCNTCAEPVISAGETHSVTLLAVDDEGCLGSGNFVYNVFPSPGISIGIDPMDPAQGENVIASLLSDETQEFTDISWKVNGKSTDQENMKAELPMDQEDNTIEVTARTENGCLISTTLDVKAEPPSYTIPNAFTPAASSNNIFRVSVKGNITVDRMRIFTRWSQLVFTDQSGKGWDGTQNGKRMPSDTYVYIIEMTMPDGRKVEKTSEVTLIN